MPLDSIVVAEVDLAKGIGPQVFSPSDLALTVQNFVVNPDGALETYRGPMLYEPGRTTPTVADPTPGDPHGVCHVGDLGGIPNQLFLRAGTQLYYHMGRDWTSIKTGLTDSPASIWPDQWLVIGDTLIWTNGVDRALQINAHRRAHPLGFAYGPGHPDTEGPESPNLPEKDNDYPNTQGYSWPGDIGDGAGQVSGRRGLMHSGTWIYYAQWVDFNGNISPMSPPSPPIKMNEQELSPYEAGGGDDIAFDLNDSTRQFVARLSAANVAHIKATLLHRTPNARKESRIPRTHRRIEGKAIIIAPDAASDAELGPPARDMAPVPVFRVMAEHGGSLVIGNFPDSPNLVRKSDPGFAGSFPIDSWVRLGSGGSECTGLASHNKMLLGMTETSIYDITEMVSGDPVFPGVGCGAPRSIVALGDGSLVWLGPDARFYRMAPGAHPVPISDAITDQLRQRVGRSRIRRAVACWDPESLSYICALPPMGKTRNTLILEYSTNGYWRTRTLGLSFADLCVSDDHRKLIFAAGRNETGPTNHLMVLNREARGFDAPTRDSVLETRWMIADPTGRDFFNVRSVHVGILDALAGNISWEGRKNWDDTVIDSGNLRTLGRDEGTGIKDSVAGVGVLGTLVARHPRMAWRQIPVQKFQGVQSFSLELTAAYPTSLLRIMKIAVEIKAIGRSGNRSSGRIATATEV